MRQCPQPAERLGVLDDNEMPRLAIQAAPRQPPGLDDPPDDGRGYGFLLITAHGQDRAHGIEDFHRLTPILKRRRIGL